MTTAERNKKLKHFITCLKCEVSDKCCDDNCSTQYEAGNMGEIIENLEAISRALEQTSKYRKEAKRWKNKALGQEPINNGWIPYSEREPEEEGRYLVCTESGVIMLIGYYDGDFCTIRSEEIVAWMPLPERYAPDINVGSKTESEDK